MTLGEYIRALRDKSDLSLREFARQLNCSAPFISDVELGRRFPSERLLEQIAALLKTTIDDLKKYDQRPPPAEEIKKLISTDPQYAIAFRRIVEGKIPAEDLLRAIKRSRDSKKGSGEK
jgi:transcriptional regulator with XRE-family HTH domain